jgi:hypothetical protein
MWLAKKVASSREMGLEVTTLVIEPINGGGIHDLKNLSPWNGQVPAENHLDIRPHPTWSVCLPC